jgi:NADPH-dependent ferric siderophore reductase
VSLRDATPVWHVRLDIARHPQGRVAVFIGVNDQAARVPRPREDRLSVTWVGAEGEARATNLPIAGAREASPGRPMTAHSLIAAGSGLDNWLRQAGEARSVTLALPEVGPFRVPATGFVEAWNATAGCAPAG